MKKWPTIAWLTILLLLAAQSLPAQDVHSSQPYAIAPLYNPAATGQFSGLYRLGAVYRDQWRSVTVPYQTMSFWADMGLFTNPRLQTNRFGFGFQTLVDRAGDGRLTTTEFGLQGAYHQSLSRENKVTASLGFGMSYGQKAVDVSRLIFNNQWSDGFFDPSQNNGEPGLSDRDGYFDMQAGIRLFAATSLHDYFFVGGALHHINRPTVSFLDSDEQLGFRPVITAGARLGLRNTTAIHPRAIFSMEKGAREITAGANFAIGLDWKQDGNKLIAGAWYRYADAAIFVAGLEWGDLQFLASYDLNASKLTSASKGNGAFELSLIFVGRKPDRELDCPSSF